jgi:hypothetical protein
VSTRRVVAAAVLAALADLTLLGVFALGHERADRET